jgi:hypothetical protein
MQLDHPNSPWILQIEDKHFLDPNLYSTYHDQFLTIFKSKHMYVIYTTWSTHLWSKNNKRRGWNLHHLELKLPEFTISQAMMLQIHSYELLLKLYAKRISWNHLNPPQFPTSIAMFMLLHCSIPWWIAPNSGWTLLSEAPGTRICKDLGELCEEKCKSKREKFWESSWFWSEMVLFCS